MDDVESVNILIREIQSEDYNPILICNPQGVVDPDVSYAEDRCLLAIQTKSQPQTYQQYIPTEVLLNLHSK